MTLSMTRKEMKRLLPKGIKHLSLGVDRCAYILNGELVVTHYSDLVKEITT
jgi:hypothetical protein